jgi:rhodanese-related sulfurtransferase
VPSLNSISPAKLSRLIGTTKAPTIVDLRPEEEFVRDPRLLPGATWLPLEDIATRGGALSPARGVVVVCRDGGARSEGVAALLREAGMAAEILEGGLGAWDAAGLPLVPFARIPPRNDRSRTLWVTRSRPKIDRIACPWLIKRFVDPNASFLFVSASEVPSVAEEFGATPFDMEDGFWSHRGELCTFDVMVEEFGLRTEPLLRLATIVRAADTDRLDLIPQAAGLLAVSLGLSRMYPDDSAQLEAGLVLYDALYHWCRDAKDEVHGWPPRTAKASRTGGAG